MIQFTLYGRPASKKNSRRIYCKNNRPVSLPSVAHEKFLSGALEQIYTLKLNNQKISEPLGIDYVFYQKGKMKQDASNAMATIEDVLMCGGVIEDDSQIVEGSFQVVRDAQEWKTEISIQKIP